MNIDHLHELDALFEYRKDALILFCLSCGVAEADGRPLHFSELAKVIVQKTNDYVPGGTISRSLRGLKERHLVAVIDEDTRHPSYQPTALGQRQAALLGFILDALDGWDEPQGE